MKRNTIVSAAAILLLHVALGAEPKPQQTRPPRAPALSTDDLLSPGASPSARTEEKATTIHSRGSTLHNALSVLQSVLTKMTEVRSVRTRIQSVLPTGQRDVLIETIKPDRTHVMSPEGEMIAIGGKFYLKTSGGWQVTTEPPGNAAHSDSGFDLSALVKQMIAKSKVLITGHVLGDLLVDGVDCTAYDFEVTDRSETGTIKVSVGKRDGYMRRLSIFGPRSGQGGSELTIDVWFTNINEPVSIQPPM